MDELWKTLEEALANQPVNDGRSAETHLARGIMLDESRQYKEAIRQFGEAIRLRADFADAYDHRGSAHFKLGHIKESIEDFDRYLKLQPKEEPGHWRRGIAFYYAGRFQEGKKQFEAYQQVDRNDVENAVWSYLCMARTDGVAKARAAMLKVGQDRRVPMTEIYGLFAGRAAPRDVLAAAEAAKPSAEEQNLRLFYAHLYLGLYYESLGDRRQTAEHIGLAAEKYPVKGYMGDVARVHWDLLRRKAPP